MTTRRNVLALAGGVAVAGGTAALIGTRPGAGEAGSVPDVLLAESRNGLVVLGGARPAGLGAQAGGRTRPPLLVTTEGRQREYDLAGVVEPDAFTSDNTGLFVLEWQPATAPDRYRVRLLDLAGRHRRSAVHPRQGGRSARRGGGDARRRATGGAVPRRADPLHPLRAPA